MQHNRLLVKAYLAELFPGRTATRARAVREVTAVVCAVLNAAAALAAPIDPLDARLRQSSAAAQALQGPLDGGWTITDARGHPRFALQIADPPGVSGPLAAAWNNSEGGAGTATVTRSRGGIQLELIGSGVSRGVLRRVDRDTWRGSLWRAGRAQPITLRRGLASAPPPV